VEVADFLAKDLLEQLVLADLLEGLRDGGIDETVVDPFGFQFPDDPAGAEGAVAPERASLLFGKLLVVEVAELAQTDDGRFDGLGGVRPAGKGAAHLGYGVRPAGKQAQRRRKGIR
jgi:hypothetical protein